MSTIRSPGGLFSRVTTMVTVLAIAATTASAQTGAVAGTVIEAASGRPLPQVRVQIVGNERGLTGTDANGRFIMRDVPAGQITVRADRKSVV